MKKLTRAEKQYMREMGKVVPEDDFDEVLKVAKAKA